MSNHWFISDTHFGHTNIIKYSNRPFSSVNEMNEKMIANWNALVKPDDTVWHLGDFAFMPLSNMENVVKRLAGHKHLILGNHDKTIIQNRSKFIGNPMFESISDYKTLKGLLPDGGKIIIFHYGMRVWDGSHHGNIMLYGHSHGSLPPFGKSVDVGVDCKEITSDYRPVSLDEVVRYMSKRTGEVVDHHGMREE